VWWLVTVRHVLVGRARLCLASGRRLAASKVRCTGTTRCQGWRYAMRWYSDSRASHWRRGSTGEPRYQRWWSSQPVTSIHRWHNIGVYNKDLYTKPEIKPTFELVYRCKFSWKFSIMKINFIENFNANWWNLYVVPDKELQVCKIVKITPYFSDHWHSVLQ